MSQNEEGFDEETDPEEVSAIGRWIDEGNPNAWEPSFSKNPKPGSQDRMEDMTGTFPTFAKQVRIGN